ncbi:hypothetical protein D3C84_724390 [compost metagenome]
MIAAIATLGRVTQRQQETFVAAGQRLQALGTTGRELQWVASDVRDRFAVVGFVLDQAFPGQQTEHSRARFKAGIRRRLRPRVLTFGEQRKVQQAMGVVEGRPQQLPARYVLERGREASAELHVLRVDRQARAEARQRGAISAQQENRLHHVPCRLFDRQRGQLFVIQRAFAHHPRHCQRQLLTNLLDAQLSDRRIAPTFFRQQTMGIVDGLFATLDGYVHQARSSAMRVLRGKPIRSWPAAKNRSRPRGNSLRRSRSAQKPSATGSATPCSVSIPGPRHSSPAPPSSVGS